jgi:hypothetical protein
MAAHISWAKTDDRSARTAPACQAAVARFEEPVDPERRLSSAERVRRRRPAPERRRGSTLTKYRPSTQLDDLFQGVRVRV